MKFKIKLFAAICIAFLMSACSSDNNTVNNTSQTDIQSVTTAVETKTELLTQSVQNNDIDNIILNMSVEEKVGQIILGRFPEDNYTEIMEQYSLGGYTVYARDLKNETLESAADKIASVQAVSNIPAFIAVDEEGGEIVRVSKFTQFRSTPFCSQLELAEGGSELIEKDTREKALLLSSIGINFNLAPVADITDNPKDYIYDRTFGSDAVTTGEYIAQIVDIMNEENMGSCLKHFPGYGSNVDTHTGIADDNRSAESFEQNDFIPFEYGIAANVPAIMVNHNIVSAYDDSMPASLSPAVHNVLRTQLKFNGVIISDDLGMDAITMYSDNESPYVLAVLAGNDLLCTSDIGKTYNDVLSAVNDGKITEGRLDESVKRVLEMKNGLNIL